MIDLIRDIVQVHVPHFPTASTHEVVVVLWIDLEVHGPSRPLQGPDETRAYQLLQVPVHGGVRHRRQDTTDPSHEIVCRRVAGRLAENTQQDLALGGHPQPRVRTLSPQVRVMFSSGCHGLDSMDRSIYYLIIVIVLR